MAAFLALIGPMHAEADPIATHIVTRDPWTFSANVYESNAPDNPVPAIGQLTYVYQLTALRDIGLYLITIFWEGRGPSNPGVAVGSGDVSPWQLIQRDDEGYGGVAAFFGPEPNVYAPILLEALQSTDLFYFHSASRPGAAFLNVHMSPLSEPATFVTIGPSVPEPRMLWILGISLVGHAVFWHRRRRVPCATASR